MFTTDFISSSEAGDLTGLFRCRASRSPEATAYRQYDNNSELWQSFSWRQIEEEIIRWRGAIANAALKPGDRVAIMHRNSVEWILFEQAALSLGLVVVPIYCKDNPGNAAFILGNCGAGLLLVGETAQWRALAPLRDQFTGLKTVIALNDTPENSPALNTHHIADWLSAYNTTVEPHNVAQDDLASIVYTSGTTGRPKGVMLSHRNILFNAEAIAGAVPAYKEDVFLSFLPLSHMLERTAGYYYPMLSGSEVAFARSVQTLSEDLQTIRPTVLISVPRMFERAYNRIEEYITHQGALAKRLFSLAKDIGWKRFEWSQGRGQAPAWGQRLIWPLLHALVVKKILARLGGRLRITISGGGRLDEQIARCFLGFGLPILQGYGLTEASPVVSGNLEHDNVPDSVGPPLPGVKVRLGENNELLVGGPGIMLGYWQRPDATADTFDAEGWLRTGDIAEIIDDKIFIRGRIKDILVTSTGEKIPRVDLEIAIGHDPLFEQIIVIGEGKPYLAALIVLQGDAWQRLASELSLDPDDPDSLQTGEFKKAILQRINSQLHEFPAYARVRAVYLTLEPWTIENGLMTSTQKLRRTQIMERLQEAIEALYAGH
jgi:long-chain acyl-CoA synthetase